MSAQIDRFALCPGGTGKKIKFCSSDCPSHLERLQKLLDARQNRAAWQHATSVVEKTPDRACMWAYKCLLERAEGDLEGHQKSAAEFTRLFPNSPVALAEQTISLALQERFTEALAILSESVQKAREAQYLYQRTVNAAITLAEALNEAGHSPAALAVLTQLSFIVPSDPKFNREFSTTYLEMMTQKDMPIDRRVSNLLGLISDADSAQLMRELADLLLNFQFDQAEKAILRHLESQPEDPRLWFALGTFRLWQMNYPGAAEAYQRSGELDPEGTIGMVGWLRAMLLKPNLLVETAPLRGFTCELENPEGVKERLLSDRRVVLVTRDIDASYRFFEEEEVPPEFLGIVLRKPVLPDSAQNDVLNDLAGGQHLIVGWLFYFGRQTDRPAHLRLEGVTNADAGLAEEILKEWVGDQDHKITTREWEEASSGFVKLLVDLKHLSMICHIPFSQILQRVAEEMPNWRATILGSRTLAEAASDPALRQKVRAVLAALHSQTDLFSFAPAVIEVWKKLGLDFPPEQWGRGLAGKELHPLMALYFDPEVIPNPDLVRLTESAGLLREIWFLIRVAPVMISRAKDLPPGTVLSAYVALMQAVSLNEPERWLECRHLVDEAVAFAESHQIPHTELHLVDFNTLLGMKVQGEAEEVRQQLLTKVVVHLLKEHADHPHVEELRRLFVSLERGLRETPKDSSRLKSPSDVEPKIWTPDSDVAVSPPGSEGEGKKIWIPGMD